MVRVEDWAPMDKINRSYELLARYVMPHFQGTLDGIIASNQWAKDRKDALQTNRVAGLRTATEAYYGARE